MGGEKGKEKSDEVGIRDDFCFDNFRFACGTVYRTFSLRRVGC